MNKFVFVFGLNELCRLLLRGVQTILKYILELNFYIGDLELKTKLDLCSAHLT